MTSSERANVPGAIPYLTIKMNRATILSSLNH